MPINLTNAEVPPPGWPNEPAGATPQYFVPGGDWIAPRPTKRSLKEAQANTPIGDLFGCREPAIISPVAAELFIKHHALLQMKKPFFFSNPKTLIGIEIEVENILKIDPNIPLMFWQVKEDGSLRNSGREFVTPGVLSPVLLEPALIQLFAGLNNDIDFSQRTSIHVHMDVRQLTLQQLVDLLLTYTAIENLFFKYVGSSRRNNIFCVPISETGLMDGMSINPTKFLHAIESYWSKYSALNLLPIVKQGSVEFRHMPGTSDVKKILRWVEMLTRIKTWVYKQPHDVVINTISDLNGNSRYHNFVEELFGEYVAYLDMSNLLMDMEKPVSLVKNCSVVNRFDAMVRKTKNFESQLGSRFGSWLSKLSLTQQQALTKVAAMMDKTDLEWVFHDVVKKTKAYIVAYPEYAHIITQIVTPELEGKRRPISPQFQNLPEQG